MVFKYGPYGKYMECTNENCKHRKPYRKSTGVKCPKCNKEIVIKKTKKGRKYYACEGGPECDFMSWQKPSKVKCDKCGSAMVEKGNKIVCMNEECKNVLNIKDIKA